MPLLEYDAMSERFRDTIEQVGTRFDTETGLENEANQIRGIRDRLAQQGTRDLALAVIGGMRLGKSSLINALVGEDLAAVGLRETTAVINVIRYGDDQPDDVFDVHWSDGRIEPVGRDRLGLWQGDSLNAEQTAHIEFRRPVPFLRDLSIIDTPGTGSTIARHEQVLKSCIERAEDLTRQECTKADAVLYVMPSVAKQRDQDLLQDVQMNSRGTALSPFNCFGVIHMWEGYASSSDDPWEAAVGMAAKNYQELRELVSGVIPVSAPLATASRIATDGQLEFLALLAMDPSDKDFKMMVLGEAMFGRPLTSSPLLSIEKRKNVQKSLRLPWPCLATVLRLLRKSKPGSAVEVRQKICEWGGRDRLMGELERRFFKRAEMVRSATLLQSFTTSCRQAERVLRKNLRAVVLQQIELGENITRTRRESMVSEIIHDPANDVLKKQRDELEGREGLLRSNLWLAGNGAASLGEDFRELDLDLRALNALSRDSGDMLDTPEEEQQQSLRGLFGYYGAAPRVRLERFLGDSEVSPEIELPRRILMFRRMAHTTTEAKTRWLFARAVERMEDLFNWWLAQADERAHGNDTNSSKGVSP